MKESKPAHIEYIAEPPKINYFRLIPIGIEQDTERIISALNLVERHLKNEKLDKDVKNNLRYEYSLLWNSLPEYARLRLSDLSSK